MNISRIDEALDGFHTAEPFPFVVIEDLIDPALCQKLRSQVPEPEWKHWQRAEHAYQVAKLACSELQLLDANFEALATELSSLSFLERMTRATGGMRAYSDPYCSGAGLHATSKGGVLAPHRDADFNSETGLRRALSLILFLTDSDPEDGGALVLYDNRAPMIKIQPKAGRCVIFACTEDSVHGVDTWQSDALRVSFAMFFYTGEPLDAHLIHAPDWHAQTQDRTADRPLALISSRILFWAAGVTARTSMNLKSLAYRLATASGSYQTKNNKSGSDP